MGSWCQKSREAQISLEFLFRVCLLLVSSYHGCHSLVYSAVVFSPIIAHSVIHSPRVCWLELVMLIGHQHVCEGPRAIPNPMYDQLHAYGKTKCQQVAKLEYERMEALCQSSWSFVSIITNTFRRHHIRHISHSVRHHFKHHRLIKAQVTRAYIAGSGLYSIRAPCRALLILAAFFVPEYGYVHGDQCCEEIASLSESERSRKSFRNRVK
jgi:hypothetical protein